MSSPSLPLHRSPLSSYGSLPSLSCPVCEETLVTLGQLNQHLDDVHQLSTLRQDNRDVLQNWLKNVQKKLTTWHENANEVERTQRNQNSNVVDVSNSSHRMSVVVPTPDYPDSEVICRRQTNLFLKSRKKMVDHFYLEGNKLEKRLEKLAKAYSNSPEVINPSFLWSITGSSSRSLEQSVIVWENDSNISSCPLCLGSFTLLNRKHHCRLCGKTICGKTSCSVMIPVNLQQNEDDPFVPTVRCCTTCKIALFNRAARKPQMENVPIVRLYNNMMKVRLKIMELLPKFNEVVLRLSNLESKANLNDTGIQKDYFVAASYRKDLVHWFSQIDSIAKEIIALPISSPLEKRLHQNIVSSTNHFLQTHMFTLSLLPKLSSKLNIPPSSNGAVAHSPALKPSGLSRCDSPQSTPQSSGSGLFLSLKNILLNEPSLPVLSSADPQKEEYLQTLIEQYSQVDAFMREATQKRRFDDVQTLKGSLDDLVKEISKVEKELYGKNQFFKGG